VPLPSRHLTVLTTTRGAPRNTSDKHFGKAYFELSANGALAWLGDIVVDLTGGVLRAGKPVTAEDWFQHLQALGESLLGTWLGVMTEATPMFLRPIVNREEFQRGHVAHVHEAIAAKIEFLKPLVPVPASPSEPNRDAASGLPSVVAESPDHLSPSAVELPMPQSSCYSDPVPADMQSKAERRREYVIPRLHAKGWLTNQDWAEAIKQQHPDKPITAHTLYNYLAGRTNSTRSTRFLIADSLGVPISDLPL
jgi:hypothetical protein